MSRPRMRTGSWVETREVRVTSRRGVTVRIGAGDAPRQALESTARFDALGNPVKRERVATERARVESRPRKGNRALTGAERAKHDRRAGIYRDEQGRVVRTLDMDDAPIPTGGVRK